MFCAIAAGPSNPNVTTARERTARGLQNRKASRKIGLRERDEDRNLNGGSQIIRLSSLSSKAPLRDSHISGTKELLSQKQQLYNAVCQLTENTSPAGRGRWIYTLWHFGEVSTESGGCSSSSASLGNYSRWRDNRFAYYRALGTTRYKPAVNFLKVHPPLDLEGAEQTRAELPSQIIHKTSRRASPFLLVI
jgi:hypothetical protein